MGPAEDAASDRFARTSITKSGDDAHSGARLGRYRILGELGRGGMGIVLLGEDPDLGREIAIKILPKDLAEDEGAYARFQREARLLAALNHPNVAIVHSLETIDRQLVLTMERIRGETLAQRLRARGLSIEETLRIATRIARAVEAAHARGVIHRDLKPGNVMLGHDDEVKVLDFGLAKELMPSHDSLLGPLVFDPAAGASAATGAADADVAVDGATQFLPPASERDLSSDPTMPGSSEDSSRAGTLGYMSPEQIQGLAVDERSDLFAFGCVLYECLTRARAFDGETARSRAEATMAQEPKLDLLPAALPEPVRTLLQSCLAKEPSSRPASAQAVRKVLEESLERLLFAQLSESIRQEVPGGERADGCPHNLPYALTSFIGREAERARVVELLHHGSLVTLTGAGGAGKTRLAVEVARALLGPEYPDGVWLIELASLTDPALLEQTMLAVIGCEEARVRPARESLLERLADARALFILDNCEHLVSGVADLVQALRRRCGRLQFLSTSREPLAVEGEARFVVPPLSSATREVEPGNEAGLASLASSDAVRLFVERAKQARSDFELNDTNVADVAEICRHLDGLPLALELAASRIRSLGPAALLARLDDRFRVLGGNARETLPHHRTLLASIEWSHDQLGETERALFRRLGAFMGGFTLESAEAVCVGEKLETWAVLDGLGSLLDKSMIEPLMSGEGLEAAPRYRMLESFREYAARQIAAAGEAAALHERFVLYWRDKTRAQADRLTGPEAKVALLELDEELPNLREAMRLALTEIEDPQVALALTGNMMGYWMRRSHWSEGTELLHRALARPGADRPTRARAVALNSTGILKYLTGRYDDSAVDLREAIVLFEHCEMPLQAAYARMNLGNAYCFSGRHEESLREHEVTLATGRELRHDWVIAAALVNICNACEALGLIDRVEEAAAEAVILLEKAGDRSNLLMAESYRGAVAYRRGRFEEALAVFDKTLAIAKEHGDRYHLGHQSLHRGLSLLGLGRREEAAASLRTALEVGDEFDELNLLANAIEALAGLAHETGRSEQALGWLVTADRLREERAVPQRPNNAASVEELRAFLASVLPAETHARVSAGAQALPLRALLDRVRADAGRVDSTSGSA